MKEADYQYVFIGGILGEILSLPGAGSYFKTNMNYIKSQFDSVDCYRYMPFSLSTSKSNAAKIEHYIEKLVEKNKKPVCIIAHSKACQETLYLALSSPELVMKEKIAGIIFVQGSFLGSSLVNILLGEQRELSRCYKLTSLLLSIFPSVKNLKLDAMKDDFRILVGKLSEDEKTVLQSKMINIVSTHVPGTKLSPVLKLGYYYYSKHFKVDSDGLLAIKQQEIPFENIRKLEWRGDHSHHFTSFPVTSSTIEHRNEVTQKFLDLFSELH